MGQSVELLNSNRELHIMTETETLTLTDQPIAISIKYKKVLDEELWASKRQGFSEHVVYVIEIVTHEGITYDLTYNVEANRNDAYQDILRLLPQLVSNLNAVSVGVGESRFVFFNRPDSMTFVRYDVPDDDHLRFRISVQYGEGTRELDFADEQCAQVAFAQLQEKFSCL
jgi:hypothetical protein